MGLDEFRLDKYGHEILCDLLDALIFFIKAEMPHFTHVSVVVWVCVSCLPVLSRWRYAQNSYCH